MKLVANHILMPIFLAIPLAGMANMEFLPHPNTPEIEISTSVPNVKTEDCFNLFTLEGLFFNSTTGLPVGGVEVLITNINNDFTRKVITDEQGKFQIRLTEESVYAIVGVKKSYFDSEPHNVSTIGVDAAQAIEAEVPLQEIKLHFPYKLEGISFDLNETEIDEKDKRSLDRLYNLMRNNPELVIEIGSHTDSRGDDVYNLALSEERAKQATAYLVKRGIAANRLIPKGYGESLPLNQCLNGVRCPSIDHQINRRTEFKILSYKN